MKPAFASMYNVLLERFGKQHWWPAESPFEVIVGAILTQNTSWGNVEKAILNLKKNGLLDPVRLNKLPLEKLAVFIRPAGYYNIKARRLKEFLRFFFGNYGGELKKMSSVPAHFLREELLSVHGIGPETADSIMLYALNKPVFVIDAYTKRVLLRHGIINDRASYDQMQGLFLSGLKKDARVFNEFHALLVRLGKELCLKNKPKCGICPLKQKLQK